MKEREIPLQVPSPQPIETAEDLLFLQRRWVTADIDRLYALLNPLVSFEIEPEEGLLLMEFSPRTRRRSSQFSRSSAVAGPPSMRRGRAAEDTGPSTREVYTTLP